MSVLYARVQESFFRDYPGSLPSGTLSFVDSEGVYAITSGTHNIWSWALLIEMKQQTQIAQLEKLNSKKSWLQKNILELRQKLDNNCDKAKKATKEAWVKRSSES